MCTLKRASSFWVTLPTPGTLLLTQGGEGPGGELSKASL